MIKYRSFLNTDPPHISEIWRAQKPIRGQVSAVSRLMLDHHVFAKPYFVADGFFLALDESGDHPKPLGFVHAGFSVNDEFSDLNSKKGIVCQLKVIPGERQQEVADALLKQACDYLIASGVSEIHAGCDFPYSPFYLGLYGGSQIPGVLINDETALTAFRNYGFEERDQIVILERRLSGFRAVVDRTQRTLKRKYQINAIADPIEKNWWESCTMGLTERDQFSVYDKMSQSVCASVAFWDMQPLASNWGLLARGLYNLRVDEEARGCGIATFLVGESLKHFMQQGIGLVEAQMPSSNETAIGVFKKLEFEEVSRGVILKKEV